MTLQLLNTSQSLHLAPIETLIQWQIHRLNYWDWYSHCPTVLYWPLSHSTWRSSKQQQPGQSVITTEAGGQGGEGKGRISCAEMSLIKPPVRSNRVLLCCLGPQAPGYDTKLCWITKSITYFGNVKKCQIISHCVKNPFFYLRGKIAKTVGLSPGLAWRALSHPAISLSSPLTNRGELQVRKLLEAKYSAARSAAAAAAAQPHFSAFENNQKSAELSGLLLLFRAHKQLDPQPIYGL